jgi:hypothetical protein
MILHIILAHLGRLKIITRLDDLNHIHENVIKRQHILMKDHNKIICHTRIWSLWHNKRYHLSILRWKYYYTVTGSIKHNTRIARSGRIAFWRWGIMSMRLRNFVWVAFFLDTKLSSRIYIVERIRISYYLAWRGFMLATAKINSFILKCLENS